MNLPNFPATITAAYLVWVIALGSMLLAIGYRVRRNPHLRELWLPVALVGTILMNLRTTCCDTAAIAVPMLLIAWRILLSEQSLLARWRAGRADHSNHLTFPIQTPSH